MTQQLVDVVGFMAAAMTVSAFYCRRMIWLRCAAICANVLFIAYGAAMQLNPVLLLHCVLLPLNIHRLVSELVERRRSVQAAGSTPALWATLRGPQRD